MNHHHDYHSFWQHVQGDDYEDKRHHLDKLHDRVDDVIKVTFDDKQRPKYIFIIKQQ